MGSTVLNRPGYTLEWKVTKRSLYSSESYLMKQKFALLWLRQLKNTERVRERGGGGDLTLVTERERERQHGHCAQ